MFRNLLVRYKKGISTHDNTLLKNSELIQKLSFYMRMKMKRHKLETCFFASHKIYTFNRIKTQLINQHLKIIIIKQGKQSHTHACMQEHSHRRKNNKITHTPPENKRCKQANKGEHLESSQSPPAN